MKKAVSLLTIVCFVATLAMFSSCSKSQEDLIVGTWKCTSVTCEPENPWTNLMLGFTFVFNADMTMSATAFGETDNGAYTIGNNKLTATYDGETIVFDIKKLDKKELTLVYTDVDEDDEGNPVTYTMTLGFTRQ